MLMYDSLETAKEVDLGIENVYEYILLERSNSILNVFCCELLQVKL